MKMGKKRIRSSKYDDLDNDCNGLLTKQMKTNEIITTFYLDADGDGFAVEDDL